MKKLLLLLLIVVTLVSCADNKTIDGVEYRPYGLLNENLHHNDSIEYQVSMGAAISGILFSELFFVPTFYTYGYNLWEPVRKKVPNPQKGIVQ